MEKTTTEMRMNVRQMRAQSLARLILEVIRPHIRDDEDGRYWERERQIFEKIHDELETLGAEVVTDLIREEAGLPARGPDGWTIEELIALEKRRIELLTQPFSVPLPGQIEEERSSDEVDQHGTNDA